MGDAQAIRTVIADDHYIFRVGTRQLLESEGGFSIVGEATNGFRVGKLGPRRGAALLFFGRELRFSPAQSWRRRVTLPVGTTSV